MNILAVDDEALVLSSLENELKEVFVDQNIICKRNVKSVEKTVQELLMKSEVLDYAFLDINLPGKSGLELAKELKIAFPKVIIIFCTAFTEFAMEAFKLYAKGYLLKPVCADDIKNVLNEMVIDWNKASENENINIRVQTFGYFDVFVNGEIVYFERKKAKELFAYLIDCRGASVTTEQIAMVLWEGDCYDRKVKNRATVVINSMRNTLKKLGIGDIIKKSWNSLSIDTQRIKCDAYDFEKGDIAALNSFQGEYMLNYSWAEFTTGRLVNMYQK